MLEGEGESTTKTLLSSPAQIIAFWPPKRGQTDICLIWGKFSLKSFVCGYPVVEYCLGQLQTVRLWTSPRGAWRYKVGQNAGKGMVERWQD